MLKLNSKMVTTEKDIRDGGILGFVTCELSLTREGPRGPSNKTNIRSV